MAAHVNTGLNLDMNIAVAQLDASRTAGVARMQWLQEQCLLAAEGNVDLLVLPELFVSGYNIGPLVETLAETVDGASAKVIAGLAKKYNMAIHYGFAERHKDGLYNAVQCIGPTGEQLGHYRKQLLPPGFEANHFSRGQQLGLFEWQGFKIGMLICFDAEFPELARLVGKALVYPVVEFCDTYFIENGHLDQTSENYRICTCCINPLLKTLCQLKIVDVEKL